MHVTFNVIIKDMKKYGYDVVPSSIAKVSEFPLPRFEDPKPGIISQTKQTTVSYL